MIKTFSMSLLNTLKQAPTRSILAIELFLLFFVLPCILATSLDKKIKIISVLSGILYVIVIGISKRHFTRIVIKLPSKSYILRVLVLSLTLFALGYFIMKYTRPNALFNMPKNQTGLWIMILFIYAFISVFAQELLYRRFFFNRYGRFFKNEKLLFFVNVICFSLCHIFLHTAWVLVATAIGGTLFSYTYIKEKSLFWTCVEHALYGNLIFTLGIGAELAFPGTA